MAKQNYNVVMHGMSGTIGDLVVFKQRNGKTIASKVSRNSKVSSDRQLAVREKFLKAVAYAKVCLNDPDRKVLYEQRATGDITSFNLAIADFFTAPVIAEINVSGYSGAAGEKIQVQATDDTKVTGLRVSIYAADGTLIEEGAALLDDVTAQWLYTATQDNSTLAGSKIIAKATDLPGNITAMEKVL
jgi:hypothetical protein